MTGRKLNLVLPSSVDSSFNLAGREKFSSDREDPRRIRNPKSGRIRFKLGLKRQEIRLCCCNKARRENVELCYFIVVFEERESERQINGGCPDGTCHSLSLFSGAKSHGPGGDVLPLPAFQRACVHFTYLY